MKSIAICLSGSLRSIEHCYENFLKSIYYYNKDKFNIKLFYYIPNDVNSDKISKIQEILDLDPIIEIKDDIKLEINNCIFQGRQFKVDECSNLGLLGWLYQIHGVEECYKMILEYEKNNNIKFDYVARMRHDVVFVLPIDFSKYINHEGIIIPEFHPMGGINDRFAFGKPKYMKIYMEMFSNLYKFCLKGPFLVQNAESFCKQNLDFHKIKYILDNKILFDRVRIGGILKKDT